MQYLRGQLDQERDANRENRRIIAGLAQRIPELEAAGPSEPPEASQTAGEGPEGHRAPARHRSASGGRTEGPAARPLEE